MVVVVTDCNLLLCLVCPSFHLLLTEERSLSKVHPGPHWRVERSMPMKIRIKIKTFFSRHFSPARIFVLSFAAVILTGGILLWFPFSATKGNLRFVDALFTSTSAVCVTGLVVIDIGKDLTHIGPGDYHLPLSDRRTGNHHVLHRLLCPDGPGHFLQGKGDCSIDISPYASKGFYCHCKGSPLGYLIDRSHWDPLPVHPIFL